MGVFAFKVLGPLEVLYEGGSIPVRGAREQAVLGVLLLEAGHVVPLARLVDAVWDGAPPQAAEKAVRNAVSALRGRLAHAAGQRSLIETSMAGYRLRLDGSWLDTAHFAEHAATARKLTAAGLEGEAVAQFRAALGLWRGPALAGLGGLVIEAAAARLDEQRHVVWEECLDLELRLGRHREVSGELQVLVREHSLRERLAGQLMLALYRSGRQAEALDAYHRLAGRLADELGIDPSGEITGLYEAILRQDGELDLAPPDAREHAQPRPGQLPLGVPGFTGRAAEIARLHALSQSCESMTGAGTVVISAIGGTAGIGKTALAIRFAHQVASQFPDGQLYVNLHGFGPSGTPVAPAAALRGFLRALGVAPQSIPSGTEDQAALYRTLVAGKRVLVVLDNALDSSQVRPLLPGSPGCLVIVTSRNALTGLAAAEGALLLTLDVLTAVEAADLLAGRLGRDRLEREPEAAEKLITLCAGLPLALAIVAARAAARPGLSLADLTAELLTAQSRLDALDTGDPATSARAVFSWSFQQLSTAAARTFRLLGLHPGPDADTYCAAALAGTTVGQARGWLDQLAGAHLLQPAPGGRYTMHDLVRAYAADLATGTPAPASECPAALERLLDYYLATASAAMDRLHPAEAHRRPRIAPVTTPMPGLPTTEAASAWLEAERPALTAVTGHAAAYGWPGHAIRLSATLYRYLLAHPADGVVICGHAVDAARQIVGDDEGYALRYLAGMHTNLGDYSQATEALNQALVLFQRSADTAGQARILSGLGLVCWHRGDLPAAIRHEEQALALFRQAGDRFGVALELTNLGDSLARLGRYTEASTHLREALVLARQDGNGVVEAYTLLNLGQAEQRADQPEEAGAYLRQALAHFTELGDRSGEAETLDALGAVLTSLRRPRQAAGHHQRALNFARGSGNLSEESQALNGLGDAAVAAGRPAEAVTHHTAALTTALAIGKREQQADAHAGLGRAHEALGQHLRAREHFAVALDLYTSLGYPKAEKIRACLNAPVPVGR